MSELRIVKMGDILDMSGEVQDFAAASDLMIELRYDGHRAGLIGFIPRTDGAYLWMHKEPLALEHYISFGLLAKRIVNCYLPKYGTIFGHSDTKSGKWLRFLGAEVKPISDTIVEFTIRG